MWISFYVKQKQKEKGNITCNLHTQCLFPTRKIFTDIYSPMFCVSVSEGKI